MAVRRFFGGGVFALASGANPILPTGLCSTSFVLLSAAVDSGKVPPNGNDMCGFGFYGTALPFCFSVPRGPCMNDSSGLNGDQTASFGPAISVVAQKWTRRKTILTAATLAVVLICSVHAMVADANTPRAAGIGYLCDSLALFGCALALW